MRVALLTPRYWPEVRRGTERLVHDLATGLAARGHEPVILTGALRPGAARIDGVRVVRLPRLPVRGIERRLPDQHLDHWALVRLAARRLRADIVHTFHHTGAAALAGSHVPVVWTHTGIPDRADLAARSARARLVTGALHRGAVPVVLSDEARITFRETHSRMARVIAPGVDPERFPLGTRRTAVPTVVCSMAADEPRKRMSLLLEAWPAVRRARPQAMLLLDGRARGQGHARDGVRRVPMDDTAALARLNGEAWAAVLPAYDEAFGLVLVEALATGTPGVAAAAQVIDRRAVGRVFDGTADGLARSLLESFELAQDPSTRAACRARAEDFALGRMVDAHLALYDELLRAGTPGT